MAFTKAIKTGASKDTISSAWDKFNDLIDDLKSTSNGLGASQIGVEDTAGNLTATDVEGAIAEIYTDTASSRTVNDMIDEDAATTTGLTWGHTAGLTRFDDTVSSVTAGTVALTDDATNYIEVFYSTVSKNTTGFTPGRIPIRQITTSSGVQTVSTDKRTFLVTPGPWGYITGPEVLSATFQTMNNTLQLKADTSAVNTVSNITFVADDDGGNETIFARVSGHATAVGDGSETGELKFATVLNGSITNWIYVDENGFAGFGNAASDPDAPIHIIHTSKPQFKIEDLSGGAGAVFEVHADGVDVNVGTYSARNLEIMANSTSVISCLATSGDVEVEYNLGVGTPTFGTNANNVIGIKNGTEPSDAPADVIQLYSKNSSDGIANATLGLYTEQAVEAGAPTMSHKLKVWINGTEYWIGLDAV